MSFLNTKEGLSALLPPSLVSQDLYDLVLSLAVEAREKPALLLAELEGFYDAGESATNLEYLSRFFVQPLADLGLTDEQCRVLVLMARALQCLKGSYRVLTHILQLYEVECEVLNVNSDLDDPKYGGIPQPATGEIVFWFADEGFPEETLFARLQTAVMAVTWVCAELIYATRLTSQEDQVEVGAEFTVKRVRTFDRTFDGTFG